MWRYGIGGFTSLLGCSSSAVLLCPESGSHGSSRRVGLSHQSLPRYATNQRASDTRVLFTAVDGGKVTPMTEDHHPDTRIEAHRLRRNMGSGLILDSFGEARYE